MEAMPRAAYTKAEEGRREGEGYIFVICSVFVSFYSHLVFSEVQRHWRKKAAMYGIMSLDLSLFRKNGRYRTETWHIIFFFFHVQTPHPTFLMMRLADR